jgi:hypothetical protein
MKLFSSNKERLCLREIAVLLILIESKSHNALAIYAVNDCFFVAPKSVIYSSTVTANRQTAMRFYTNIKNNLCCQERLNKFASLK